MYKGFTLSLVTYTEELELYESFMDSFTSISYFIIFTCQAFLYITLKLEKPRFSTLRKNKLSLVGLWCWETEVVLGKLT